MTKISTIRYLLERPETNEENMSVSRSDGIYSIDREEGSKIVRQTICIISPMRRLPSYKPLYEFNYVQVILTGLKLSAIPEQIYFSPSIRILSLSNNLISQISPNIGRLRRLEILELDRNRLTVESFPHTIVFCSRLHTLDLDSNLLLEALPAFLLQMRRLTHIRKSDAILTQLRHFSDGQTNRITRWHSTMDTVDRTVIFEPQSATNGPEYRFKSRVSVQSLKAISLRSLVVTKRDYFTFHVEKAGIEKIIADHYFSYKICDACENPRFNGNGYAVVISRRFFSTSLIFYQRACSLKCAQQLYNTQKSNHCEAIGVKQSYDLIQPSRSDIHNVTSKGWRKYCCAL